MGREYLQIGPSLTGVGEGSFPANSRGESYSLSILRPGPYSRVQTDTSGLSECAYELTRFTVRWVARRLRTERDEMKQNEARRASAKFTESRIWSRHINANVNAPRQHECHVLISAFPEVKTQAGMPSLFASGSRFVEKGGREINLKEEMKCNDGTKEIEVI